MRLAARAWRLRERARQALAGGEAGEALALAVEAQELCGTPAGRQLELVSRWLDGLSTYPEAGS